MIAGDITGLRGVDLGVRDVAAADRQAVDRLHAQVAAAGAVQIGAPAPITEPGGGYGFAFLDPEGRSVRVIAEDARHADARLLPDRPERITHVVLNSPRPGRHGPGNNVFAYFIAPDDFVVEYTAEVEKVDENHRAREPKAWAYPPGHSDLWGATPPPSARMKSAQEKIRFAVGLFHP